MFYLKLFGSPVLRREDEPITGGAVQRHRIALLALLALAPGRRMSRDKLLGYLWPERDTENARNLLKVATYVLRGELGDTALLTDNDELRLNDEIVQVDVVAFESAVKQADPEPAIDLYTGPLLDGFFLNDAPEFDQWVEQHRTRLGNDFAGALERLAVAAEGAGQLAAATEWWKRRSAQNPHDSRVALRLIEALDANGSRVLALQQAAVHEHLLREEFGIEPSPEMVRFVEQLRARPLPPRRRAEPAVEEAASSATISHAPAVILETRDKPASRIYARFRRARTVSVLATVALFTILLGGAVYSVGALRPRAAAPARALAVMPFVNMTAEGGGDYFSDGLTEEIISVLSRIPELRVAARTSSFALRDKGLDIRAIGDTLNVNVVLEGSVRREGNRLRVTAQLIDAKTGYHIWSGNYDRQMQRILEVQDEIATDIAQALELRMPKHAKQSASGRAPNLQAYDLYLRALYLRDTFTPEALNQARRFLDRATELDPDFALAYAHKATVLGPALFWRHVPLESGVPEARAAVTRALALDPQLGDAYGALGMIKLFFDWDFPGAQRALQRAVALNPNDHHAWHQLANYYRAMGEPAAAARARAQAVALDPLNVRMGVMLADDQAATGRIDEGLAQFDRSSRLYPAHPMIVRPGPYVPAGPWRMYWSQGRHANVVAEFLRMASLRGASADELAELRSAFEQRGMPAFWLSWLEYEQRYADPAQHSVSTATFYALAGDTAHALEWLERAHAEHNPALIFVIKDPMFRTVREQPRFRRIVQQMKFPTSR